MPSKTVQILKGTLRRCITKLKQIMGKSKKTIKKMPKQLNSMLSRSLRSKKRR